MADPFSIFAGTVGVIDVTSRFVQYMRTTGAAAARVNEELETLLYEFQTLSSVAKSIQSLQPAAASEIDPQPLKDLRYSTGKMLIDCRQTLERLEKLVKDVFGNSRVVASAGEHDSKRQHSKRAEKVNNFRVQLRKQRRDCDFSRLRERLNTLQSALQLSLQMINQSHNQRIHSMTEKSLDHLLEKFQMLVNHLYSQQIHPLRPVLEYTNKYFEAPAAKSLYVGRAALLEQVSTAFLASLVQSGHPLVHDPRAPSFPIPSLDTQAPSPQPEHDLKQPPATRGRRQQRFVIYGLSGSGKTEFCLQFCERHQRNYWGIFWINASSDEKAQHSFNRIAKYGEGGQSLKAAQSWLSSSEYPWLLVIDSADDPSIPIMDYIPGGERGHVLITTRNPDLRKFGTVGDGFSHLEGLEEHEAKLLLLQTAEVPSPWQPSALDLAATITKALGYLPLALVHAGTAIARGLSTLAEYVNNWDEIWKSQRLQWQLSGKNAAEFDSGKNVFASYDMMYQELDNQSSPEARDAIEMLKMFAFLDCENIGFDFLAKAARNPWDREQKHLEHEDKKLQITTHACQVADKPWPQRLKECFIELLSKCEDRGLLPSVLRDIEASGCFQPARLRQALSELTRQSLVTHRRMGDVDIYSMHPLVHRWVRERPQMRLRERGLWCQAAASILTQAIALPPLGTTDKEQQMRRQLLPHLDYVRKRQAEFHDQLKKEQEKRRVSWMLVAAPHMDRKKALQFAKFSRVYMECGRFSDAANLQLEVKDYFCKMMGMKDRRTQDISLALAKTYIYLTRPNEALGLQQEALNSCIDSLGRDHYRTLKMMDSLGESQCARGRFKEALKLHEDAMEGMKKILPVDHEDIFRAMDKLGVVYQKYFQWQKAKTIHIEAVEGLTRARGPTDDDTLFAIENLAMTNLEIGGDSLQDARDAMEKVVEQRCKTLGKESALTLWSKLCLARIKSGLGLEEEAETDMRAGIKIAAGNLGEDHIGVTLGRTQLAKVLVRQQRYPEAEEILLDTMELSRYKAGAREEGDHPDRLMAVWHTVECYRLQGKFEGAIRLCTEILDSLQKMPRGAQHPLAIQAKERVSELREPALALRVPSLSQRHAPGIHAACNRTSGVI